VFLNDDSLFVSCYFPDSFKPLEAYIACCDELGQWISETRTSHPWKAAVLGCDANTVLPHFGGEPCERTVAFQSLVCHLDVMCCVPEDCEYTHINYKTKSAKVLDYVFSGGSSISSVSCNVMYEANMFSDHFPIATDIFYSSGARSSFKRSCRRRLGAAPDFRCMRVVNRYAALMESVADSATDSYTLQQFGKDIVRVSTCSAAYNLGGASCGARAPVKVVVAPLREAILAAETPAARLSACRAYSHARKAELKSRLEQDFASRALKAPREDRKKECTIKPIYVTSPGGALVPSFDAEIWVSEFRKLYCDLFADPENSIEVQRERLRALATEANKEDHIVVPLWLVHEVLSQSNRKRDKAVGPDSISWGALGCLPLSCIELLRKLIEARLNNCAKHNLLIEEWSNVLVTLIPKSSNARLPSQWRPIAVSSILQKLYLAVVIRCARYFARDVMHEQCGFSEGRQPMECSELCRMVVHKSCQWGTPACLMKLDAARAFDSLRHEVIADCLIKCGFGYKITLALLRELSENQLTLLFQGVEVRGILYAKGGKQGGADTPEIWRRVFNDVLENASRIWHEKKLGIVYNDYRLCYQAWADDVILFARSCEEVRAMFEILLEALHEKGLGVKKGSLEVMCVVDTAVLGSRTWHVHGEQHEVLFKNSLNILGVLIDETGCSRASISYRISQAWVHFHARSKQLCCKKISLKLRFIKLRDTVFRTCLHGAGGWSMDSSCIALLDAFESKVLKLVMGKSRKSGESDAEFHCRLNRSLKWYKEGFGWTSLSVLAMHLHFGWWGHVRRHGGTSLSSVLAWRDRTWIQENRTRSHASIIRYARPGPQFHYDDILHGVLPAWADQVADRHAWRKFRADAVPLLATTAGHWHTGLGPLQPVSNKFRDWSRDCRLSVPIKCLFVSDNQTLVNSACGRSDVKDYAAYQDFLRWSFHFLAIWGVSKLQNREFIEHWPREYNVIADALVNSVLDGSDCAGDVQLIPARVEAGGTFVVCTDGGSRGNPGAAAAAAVLFLHVDGALYRVASWCCDLGISTSAHAEFEAACLGVNLLLLWLLSFGYAHCSQMKSSLR
jgi:hypothetical protein